MDRLPFTGVSPIIDTVRQNRNDGAGQERREPSSVNRVELSPRTGLLRMKPAAAADHGFRGFCRYDHPQAATILRLGME